MLERIFQPTIVVLQSRQPLLHLSPTQQTKLSPAEREVGWMGGREGGREELGRCPGLKQKITLLCHMHVIHDEYLLQQQNTITMKSLPWCLRSDCSYTNYSTSPYFAGNGPANIQALHVSV